MAKTAVDHMEVRYRVKDSGEAWSNPLRAPSLQEIAVADLDRTQEYEFQARNVSACGAKSNWADAVQHTVPPPPDGTLTLDAIRALAASADASAGDALAKLNAIDDDRTLSPNEKPVVIRDYNVILAEKPGLDAQADAQAAAMDDPTQLAAAKAAYDQAIADLTTYLDGLTTPVAWDDLSGNTTLT